MNELITVKDLKVHFPIRKGLFSRTVGRVYAVDGVSLTLNRGETLGVVGESGCGKTTLGTALLRLLEPTGGTVCFQGKQIAEMTPEERRSLRREMQIIFQDPNSSLNPRMTVNQTLAGPLKVHRIGTSAERKDRVEYLLTKVGLTPHQADRYPHEFSGGQKQRIGIARALALNPKVIIADEPVSALDVSIQAQIINLLTDLQQEFALSYILIAHDLAVIEHICDRIAVMYLGNIVETADYRDIYHSPRHPYTRALLSAIPRPDPRIKRDRIILKGDVPSPMNPPPGCRFHTRCPERFEPCDRIIPEIQEVGAGHFVACHLY